jgi:hypothetical protein
MGWVCSTTAYCRVLDGNPEARRTMRRREDNIKMYLKQDGNLWA